MPESVLKKYNSCKFVQILDPFDLLLCSNGRRRRLEVQKH